MNFGDLYRTTPISDKFGFDRGSPVDRYYIDRFLDEFKADVAGRVLEIGDPAYTLKFGGERVKQSDVLHVSAGKKGATIVGDFATGRGIPSDAFDCIILTQTLHCIYDFKSAISNIHRSLSPGGVLLATFPGISQISRYDMDRWGDFWRFTTASAERMFSERFEKNSVTIRQYGNVFAATAFLYGLAHEELDKKMLDATHPDYQMLIAVRAKK